MANSASALKRVRQIKSRTLRNTSAKTRVKSLRKKIYEAVESKDKEAAAQSYKEFSSAVDRALKSNIYHANKVANLKSKMNKVVKSIA